MTNANQELLTQISQLSSEHSLLMQQMLDNQQKFRGLAKRVWQVQEAERKRIAGELHDGIGQILTALINQLEQKSDSCGDELELARHALADTRELSRLLRPPMLDDLGLAAALQWLVRVMQDKSKTQIELHLPCVEKILDGDLATLIFRLVQEALTNMVKYAQASHCVILLRCQDNEIILDIMDDGQGFATENFKSGFGIHNMRDRVEAFAGKMKLQTAQGQGCRLLFFIPFSEDS